MTLFEPRMSFFESRLWSRRSTPLTPETPILGSSIPLNSISLRSVSPSPVRNPGALSGRWGCSGSLPKLEGRRGDEGHGVSRCLFGVEDTCVKLEWFSRLITVNHFSSKVKKEDNLTRINQGTVVPTERAGGRRAGKCVIRATCHGVIGKRGEDGGRLFYFCFCLTTCYRGRTYTSGQGVGGSRVPFSLLFSPLTPPPLGLSLVPSLFLRVSF